MVSTDTRESWPNTNPAITAAPRQAARIRGRALFASGLAQESSELVSRG